MLLPFLHHQHPNNNNQTVAYQVYVWGVLGASLIARVAAVVPSTRVMGTVTNTRVETVAVAARDSQRAAQYCRKLGIGQSLGDETAGGAEPGNGRDCNKVGRLFTSHAIAQH